MAIYLRLTPQKSYKRTSWANLAVCTLWIIPSILIITINCESNKPWAPAAAQCTNLVNAAPYLPGPEFHTDISGPACEMAIYYCFEHCYRGVPLRVISSSCEGNPDDIRPQDDHFIRVYVSTAVSSSSLRF